MNDSKIKEELNQHNMIIMFWTPLLYQIEFDLKLKELQELENKP
jgi:hypothetical protein